MEASWRRSEHQVPAPVGDPIHLLVAGDTHGNLDWIGTLSKLAARFGCAGVVQLGDFGFWPDQRIWRSEQRAVINHRWLDAVAERAAHHGVWWRVLDGNHDAHPLARAAFASDDNGVRPIRDGVLDWADRGAVWEWAGVRFAALGGGVSIDRSWRCEGRDWWATETITDADVDALIERAGPDGVDVLLTHDAPMLPPGVQPLADPVLRADCAESIAHIVRAVDAVRPSVVLHGHFHRRYRAVLERPWGNVRVEGVASDQEVGDKYGGPWVILELPSLAVG
jgi:hypothetical protein